MGAVWMKRVVTENLRYKLAMVALIAAYVCLSFLPCMETWQSVGSPVKAINNNFDLMIPLALLQVLFVLCGHNVLQLFTGACLVFRGMTLPLAVKALNAVVDSVHVVAGKPNPHSAMRPEGWALCIFASFLLAADIWFAVRVQKRSGDGTEERDEAII